MRPRRLVLFAIVLGALLLVRDSVARDADPAARGLDVFLHLPANGVPGGVLELNAEAFGFPSVTRAVPLAGASIVAAWDPESLGGAAPPPPVRATTDAHGRARLRVPIPPGPPRGLVLLVDARHGVHERTRSVDVRRSAPRSIELHAADSRVVPGSTISAWVRVVDASGDPAPGAAVTVSLLEGGVARYTEERTTDRGGLVMARVPIPRIDEPVWRWTLRAAVADKSVASAQITLTPRDETPGEPVLLATWHTPASGVLAGDRVPFTIRLRDAVGQPLVDAPVRYWIGARGTTPPSSDEAWKRASTRAKTNGAGEITGAEEAPAVVTARGTAMTLIARAVVAGHALERKATVSVGGDAFSVALEPEARAVVPGLTQHLLLTVRDARGAGVAGRFEVHGDGLDETVTTSERGEADVVWTAPLGVGATREVGPCAGGVAAAVTIRPAEPIAALATRREPFTRCVSVDRDAEGVLRVEPKVARPGERVRVTVVRAKAKKRANRAKAYSVVARSREHAGGLVGWLAPGAGGDATGELVVPDDAAAGLWSISAAAPDGDRAARVVGAAMLVVPKVVPVLEVKRTGGRAAPGGAVEVEARLTDGHGRGLPGSISTLVVDAFGGGHANVMSLDTRARLCGAIGADDRCAAVLERAPQMEAQTRAMLGALHVGDTEPASDPGAHARRDLDRAFADVVHSLEGAVFEAATRPEAMLDVRRKEHGRWVFNPEMFTLVTSAMSKPPLTPGGEKLTLADLVAVDPQVTFDNVARRVTRLKLFRVLVAVRRALTSQGLGPDEPITKHPNALVRRLVREGSLTRDLLLDPWGGAIQFVKRSGRPIPFLSTVRGFELRAPGPDGRVGTADDVRDPFERVLRSKSPYAEAVDEDRLVDAKWDMVVGQPTVDAWERMFAELTGTSLGLGLSGTGVGGGGSGSGAIGLGSVGTIGHGRSSSGWSTGDAFWSRPTRTDAEGRVHLTIPLGDAETTWRVAVVGVPDGLSPAAATLGVASELPLSAQVEAGARWIVGDEVGARVLVRNRTDKPLRATVRATAEGAARVVGARDRQVDVPAHGARALTVRVRAAAPGEAALVVQTSAPGAPADTLRHSWQVARAGERLAFTRTRWVEGRRELALSLDDGISLAGAPRLVLERGLDSAVAAALASLDPDRQVSTRGLVDAFDAARRVARWSEARSVDGRGPLLGEAKAQASRALGRYEEYAKLDAAARGDADREAWLLRARVLSFTKADRSKSTCPVKGDVGALAVLPPPGVRALPCWGAYVSNMTRSLATDRSPERVARALLAFAERPRHNAVTANLAERLRRLVKLTPTGDLDVEGLEDRSARALVYAALLRTVRFGASPATAPTLFGKLAILRDVGGGYGSSEATLGALEAMLSSQLSGHGTTRARVTVARPGQAPFERSVVVPESGRAVVALPPRALAVTLETEGPALVARFVRPVLRAWSKPPPTHESPVSLEVVWPAKARARGTGMLRVMLSQSERDAADVDVRVPLPPGVTLAAATPRAWQIHGVLALRQRVDRGRAVIEVPLRFGLGGRVTVPEATARVARSPSKAAAAPARQLTVR